MSRKFKADKLAKQFVQKDRDIEDEYNSSSESEEDQLEIKKEFAPSRIRQSAMPDIKVDIKSKGGFEDHANLSDNEYYEEEEENGYSNEDSDAGSDDSDGLSMMNEDAINDLADEIDEDEPADLIESMQKQQEEDLKIAKGTSALQDQKKRLLSLFFKMHALMCLVNQLPPTSLDDDSQISPYALAAEDPEIAQAFQNAAKAISELTNELKSIKEDLEKFYGWEGDDLASTMMGIITQWGQKVRLSAGMKHGSVINRPIEQQISAALHDKEMITAPTRAVAEKRVFGGPHPDYLHANYNDEEFYDKQLREIVDEKAPQAAVKVRVGRPTKATLRSHQISYEPIPELQGFMSATMEPVPDNLDALLRSLMGQ